MTITGLHTVGMPVTDQDRRPGLLRGARVRDAPRRADGAGRTVDRGGASRRTAVTLALELAHAGRPAGVETGIRLTTADADAAHAALRARGVDVDDVLRWPGVPPMFAFRDQDGNGLEIVEA